jgi:hypothetical protein
MPFLERTLTYVHWHAFSVLFIRMQVRELSPGGRLHSAGLLPSSKSLLRAANASHFVVEQLPMMAWGLALSFAGTYFAARARRLRRVVMAVERLPVVNLDRAINLLYRKGQRPVTRLANRLVQLRACNSHQTPA